MFIESQGTMDRIPEFHDISNSYVYANYDVGNEKAQQVAPPFLVDSSSPLSSVSIPSPPSISPTPETYNKQELYQNVEYLKVSRPSVDDSRNQDSGSNNKPELQAQEMAALLHSVRELKHFLVAAPSQFRHIDIIHQFRLPTEEQISCVRWNNVYCITGTDIVRILAYRFSVFGRDVVNRKKFEEGVFSDLRNLKINVDATLENPKSELLEFLYKRHCVRTKKKQKVFFWYSVQHERLFVDALERELKKDMAITDGVSNKSGIGVNFKEGAHFSSTLSTIALREPALSFQYDPSSPLSEQLANSLSALPDHFSDLVKELTIPTSRPNYSSNANDIATQEVYSSPSSHSLPWYGGQMRPSVNLRKEVEGDMHTDCNNPRLQASIQYPANPSTPLQSNSSKSDFRSSLMLTPFDDQSYRAVCPQHKEKSRHGSPVINFSSLYQTPPNSIAQQVSTPNIVPEANASTSKNYGHCATLSSLMKFADDPSEGSSDFPLDVLVKEDESMFRSNTDFRQSFDTKYTDFAHHNRPALSLQNRHTLWVQNNESQSPRSHSSPRMLVDSSLRNYHQQSHQQSHPTLGGDAGAPPQMQSHMHVPQSPDWDQFIYSEPLSATRPDHPSVLSSPFQPYSSLTRSSAQTRDMLSNKSQGRVSKQIHTRLRDKHPQFPMCLHDEC